MFGWALLAVAWLAALAAAEVRNLTVKVVDEQAAEDGSFDGRFLETPLRLNVSWLPPEGRQPKFYSVVITSANNSSSNNTSDSCGEGSIYYVGRDVSETSVLLPEKNRFNDETTAYELDIEPGCSYGVQVFANPRNNHGAAPSATITIPECVGSRCNCDRALDSLPVPAVSARSLRDGGTLISWKVESGNSSDVHSYRISVGIPHLTSSSGLVVYNKTQIFTGTPENDSYVWTEEKFKKGTKIFVTAQDAYGCSGREGSYTMRRPRHHQFYRKNVTAVVFAGLLVLLVMTSGLFSFIRYLRRHHSYKLISFGQKSTRQITSVLHNSKIEALLKNRNVLYVDQEIVEARRKDQADPCEISYGRLRLVRELGQGQFGRVYLANLQGHSVAVKMSLTSSDSARAQLEVRQELLEEIAIIKLAGSHPHLVGLVGCCTLPENPVCLVLEYMQGGDLLGYLHRMRDAAEARNDTNSSLESPGVDSIAETTCTSLSSYSPSSPAPVFFANDIKPEDIARLETEGAVSQSEMMRFALEIAKGMEHLEARGIVHRDLAARNVLMDERLVLKISDFGLSRRGAYTLGGNGVRRLPIRWMPPEAIRRRAFTSKSDVWSYGLVLWEIGSLGDFPYPRLPDDELLVHLLEEGGRPVADQAVAAPVEMKEAMDMCWARQPERRPNFKQIVLWLESRRAEGNKNNPVYHGFSGVEDA